MTGGNPLLINVVELRRSVGNQRVVREDVVLDDIGLVSARVVLGSSLDVDLTLETMSGGIAANGAIHGRWDGECRRCLDPVSGPLDVDVAEVFEDVPTEGETYPITADHIDLEPMVRELTVLALPINPLCRDDCAGPIPDVLPVVVEGDDEAEPALDPRWAALDALRESN